jgi:hypothetical protein
MKKIIITAVVTAMVLGLVGTGFAANAGSPSAKATAKIGYLDVFSCSESSTSDHWDFDTSEGWNAVLTQTIKTVNPKDLFIDVSLQTGMYTFNQVKSKNG